MDGSFFDDDFGEDWDETTLSQIQKTEADFMLEDSSMKEDSSPDIIDILNQDIDDPSPNHMKVLNEKFGHKKFKPLQWQIIKSIIKDQRDCCAIMKTGYGKSLCFQYPSVYSGGMTVVISPLISLMQDQVLSMKIANIPACLLGSANEDQIKTIEEIFDKKYSLVYCTPEFCSGDLGKKLLVQWNEKLSIDLIAIDEAHCVSSWGHDFRTQYRQLGFLKGLLPAVPILAVTATATEKVRQDIIKSLNLRNPHILNSSLDRENFYFEVNQKSNSIHSDLKKLMLHTEKGYGFCGSTIIYCITRKKTEELAHVLTAMGVKNRVYHAGLTLPNRKKVHEEFVRDQVEVVVATIAFGMGIDKPDVRRVIHYGISHSIENYYQEAGRAGRDGSPAKCIVFYNDSDIVLLRLLTGKSVPSEVHRKRKENMLQTVECYLNTRECRRKFILSYLEGRDVAIEKRPSCCDNCSKRTSESKDYEIYEGIDKDGKYDFTEDAKLLLKLMTSISNNFGIGTFIHILRGTKEKKISRHKQNPYHGSGKNKSELWWKEIGKLLTRHQYITLSYIGDFMNTAEVTEKGEQFLKNSSSCLKDIPSVQVTQCLKTKGNIWINSKPQTSSISARSSHASSSTTRVVVSPSRNNEGREETTMLYKKLLCKRLQLAEEENCMPYMIASNKALLEMAEERPTSLEEAEKHQFDGMTAVKLSKYGMELLKVISPSSPSIQLVLNLNPLPNIPDLTQTMTTSLFEYQSGNSFQEIAKKRNISVDTIVQHLTNCMKYGHSVKLSSFGVTDKIALIIIRAIKTVETGITLLKPIKMACSDDIDYLHIKGMVNYLQVREHLDSLNLPYQDFEEVDYYNMYKSQKSSIREGDAVLAGSNGPTQVQEQKNTKGSNLSQFIRLLDEVEEKPEAMDDHNIVDQERECERHKTNEFSETSRLVLDSPERQTDPLAKNPIAESSPLDSPPRQSSQECVDHRPEVIKKRQANEMEIGTDGANFGLYGKPVYLENNKGSEVTREGMNVSKKQKSSKLPPWLTTKKQ